MKQWAKVIEKKGVPETILVADSYCLTQAARSTLSDLKVRYMCSITKKRFPYLVEEVKPRVEKPGTWAASWNDNTGELLTYYWSTDKDVGKKFVLTNALFKEPKRSPKSLIPAYDMYSVMFAVCDLFNRGLHDCTWPHRTGGGTCEGTNGIVHDFFFTAILKNTMNAWLDLNAEDVKK